MGKGGGAPAEHLEDKFKHAAAGREGLLKKDPAEEGLEKPLSHGLTESEVLEGLPGGHFRTGLNAGDGVQGEACLEGSDAQFVGEGTRRGAEGVWKLGGVLERINEAEEGFPIPDEGSGEETPEPEAVVIEEAPTFGIGVEEDLEAPVEEEPLDPVGADTSPRLIRGLEEAALATGPGEGNGAAQAGEAGTDNGHIKDLVFHVLQTD